MAIVISGVALTGVAHKAWQMIKRPRASPKREEQREQPPESEVPLSADDPLWGIVGLGRSAGPTDLSENVDKHLAEAYRAEKHRAL
jgi:hypothetical protein